MHGDDRVFTEIVLARQIDIILSHPKTKDATAMFDFRKLSVPHSYNSYKWAFKWVTGVTTPISGVITLYL